MNRKPTILHICSDYPDPVQSANKTRAVYNLVNHTTDCNHVVFSLNRSTGVGQPSIFMDAENRSLFVVRYRGLPKGIGLKIFLEKVAECIASRMRKGIAFDLVHAHKLTIEGIVGHYIAKKFQKPLVLTVRGETDLQILRFKPGYRKFYGTILGDARRLFFLAPWTSDKIEKLFGISYEHKSVQLPNIVFYSKAVKTTGPKFSDRFITAVRFDAKNYKSKNLYRTIQGFDLAAQELPEIRMDIAGDGESVHRRRIERHIRGLRSASRIHFTGRLSNQEFCSNLPKYAAFVRPSCPETFGMVFMESLFAGLPVLHARNTGIDGYFPDADFAVPVNHKSIKEISRGFIYLHQNQIPCKQALNECLNSGRLEAYRTENIVKTYMEAVDAVLTGRTQYQEQNATLDLKLYPMS